MLLPVQLWGPRGDPVPVPAPSGAGRASRGGHLTWDLVQELVGGAGQDPDPIQLWHQVGVLIQDESVLPAKGSREGSGAEPAQPSSVPPSPTPPAGPHEPPPLLQDLGRGRDRPTTAALAHPWGIQRGRARQGTAQRAAGAGTAPALLRAGRELGCSPLGHEEEGSRGTQPEGGLSLHRTGVAGAGQGRAQPPLSLLGAPTPRGARGSSSPRSLGWPSGTTPVPPPQRILDALRGVPDHHQLPVPRHHHGALPAAGTHAPAGEPHGVRERCPQPRCSTGTAPQPPRLEQGHEGRSHSSRGGRGAGQTPAKRRASRGVWRGAQPGGDSQGATHQTICLGGTRRLQLNSQSFSWERDESGRGEGRWCECCWSHAPRGAIRDENQHRAHVLLKNLAPAPAPQGARARLAQPKGEDAV